MIKNVPTPLNNGYMPVYVCVYVCVKEREKEVKREREWEHALMFPVSK